MSNVEDGSNSDDGGQSSTPTPSSHLHRNLGSSWSAADTASHHHQGTSYFTSLVSPSSTPSYSAAATILMRSSSGHSIRRGICSISSTAHALTAWETTRHSARRRNMEKKRQIDDGVTQEKLFPSTGHVHGDSSDEHEQETEETPRDSEDPIMLKERQSLINVDHPFSLPIWKPAFYKKSRSVTQYADAD